MLKLIVTLARSPLCRRGILCGTGLVLVLIAGFGIYSWFRGPKIEIVTGPGNATTVYIDRPVLVPKEVVRYVEDRANVQKLLDENAALRNQITVLAETIAELRSTGSGSIVYVDRPVPGETRTVRQGDFRDWRLHFTFQDDQAQYELTQRFEALAAAGHDREGRPTATVRLFEIGPGDTRTPLTTTKTTVVAASGQGARWLLSPSIQAGAAISDTTPGALVGVQWLKRGTTKAAEDNTYALMTPVVFVSSGRREIGLLPASVNLGRLPRQPFKDLWVSPYLAGSGRFGIAVTATF